ncbi:fatty acid desaturase [Salisediminibacterium halotolerans]|uniref:fatty acid desaturase n=1 Tax=Salisediminibacterium halotolerans TaxID=517425 RepID=UPI000EAD444C|nr:fatty acid desaturase [Salisediminibacterium halotolerans]RLJ69700.1 omega-6 fatty acid desaturase (delta-12 desaturase) [Actinophytocola xinjiangensis]RPE89758.1 omega-6 fatty acid desaturase (delta-12 desaturase) [Salisediminibacterium halotolerans]TWG32594.1 omega-6 fatty acid desaturase (delta-12 desaturase) [Salisediminibacterium halotolerans]GEL08969.1 fatty acid desaturase [Salisediminibacterium halotolerans]
MSQKNIAELKKDVKPFEQTNSLQSMKQMVNTLLPFLLLWGLAFYSLQWSYLISIPLIILASGFLVRTFIIFHDCCHQSFFKSRKANRIVGTITGVLTHVPYEQWKNSHNIHHATSSNLDKRGTGDMWLMTVDEYEDAPRKTKIAYRLYRNPVVMLGLGPIVVFLVQYRFNVKNARRKERLNTYITNVSIVAVYTALVAAFGWQAVLLIQAPIAFLSGMAGIWLFYVQHQFEESYFEHDDEWSYVHAAVDGSSYYELPKVLQWLSGNIGFHHVHHLSPRVPNYYLEDAHIAAPPLQRATKITLWTSLKSLRFRLWDEETKSFVGFRAARRLSAERNLCYNNGNRLTMK